MTPTVCETIARNAADVPDRVAIVFIDEDGTHTPVRAGALQHEIHAYAAALRAFGVVPGDLVVLGLRYSWPLIPCFFGAMSLGAAPSIFAYFTDKLDPKIYAQRLHAMIRDSDARVLIAETLPHGQVEEFAAVGCRVIEIDRVRNTAATAEGLAPPAIDPDQLALVQFTSGTTDREKGVALTHRQILDFLAAFTAGVELRHDDVFVSWLPLNHDMGLYIGLVIPLVAARQTVLMSPMASCTSAGERRT